MKKIYLTIGLLTTGYIGLAQHALYKSKFAEKRQMVYEQQHANAVSARAAASTDTIFYEGFGKGMPSGWSREDNVNFCNWTYTTIGAQGQYSNKAKLNSTSKANGYMILDVDYCNGDSSRVADAFLQSPKLDLSNYPNVNLNFQHLIAYCCDPSSAKFVVQVSNDSTNWTDFDVKKDLPMYLQTANPKKESINITEVAGGKSTVWIRFYSAGIIAYYWMVDDVLLTPSPASDMILENFMVDFLCKGCGNYTRVPLGQATVGFRGASYNGGVKEQTGVKLNVKIKDTKSVVTYNETSDSVPSVIKLQRDTLAVANPFVPTALGNQIVTFTLKQDSADDVPANNVLTTSFMVSDSVFARDNDNPGGLYVGPSFYTGGDIDGSGIGTMYDFSADGEINSVSVFVHAKSDIGSSFNIKVYDINNNFADLGLETGFYDIDGNSKVNKWVTLPFTNKDGTKEIIPKDASVVVAVETYGGKVFLARDFITKQPDRTSWVQTGGQWGWISDQPFIRLNLAGCSTASIVLDSIVPAHGSNNDGAIYTTVSGGTGKLTTKWTPSGGNTDDGKGLSANKKYVLTVTDENGCSKKVTYSMYGVGIDEQSIFSNFNVYPNPANTNLTVNFNTNYTLPFIKVKLVNVTGQVIYSEDLKQFAGEFKKTIDLTSNSKGVYFLQVISDKNVMTKKVIKY